MKQRGGRRAIGPTAMALAPVLLVLGSVIAAVLLVEGAYSLYSFSRPHHSVVHSLYKRAWPNRLIAGAGQLAPSDYLLSDKSIIEKLLPQMKEAGIGLGNTPYTELKTETTAVNHRPDGCLAVKPHLNKTMRQLRSGLFNPLDPVNLFYDAKADLHPRLADFVKRYGLRELHYSSDAAGYRTTVPSVQAKAKVLVAGDSVANGVMVDDAETLSSQLQARSADRQYINIAVGGASARDVVCAIERAMARFESDVREIIYVYCENDFRVGEPYGRPEEVVAWLKRFAQQRSIERIVMVYAPYIYNVAPHILGRTTLTYVTEREALLARSKEAGFVVVDIGELAATEVQRRKTEFAALSLFVDHVHLSVYGTQMLAQRILDSRL